MKLQTASLLTAATACVALTASSAHAALVVDLGDAGGQLSTTTSAVDVQETSDFTTGTFTTTGAGPVTFDLAISATNGNVLAQSEGFGVDGGSANQGVDNGNSGQETMTFTISDFTGLGVGESLVITSVDLLFGDVTETYTINSGSNIFFTFASTTSTPEIVDVPDAVSATIGAGSLGDTKFAVGSFTVAVIPEPSSLALMGLGGLLIVRRRRG